MKLLRKVGATSEIWQVFIRDSSSTTGGGLTGLVFNSAGLTAYYHRDTDTTATAITLATMTVGTFTSSGFKEIDATNMPGWYQFCPPNAAIATGAKSCAFHLKGATNMAPLPIEVDLNGQPAEVTGAVGSVTGAVGSVTGAVGSVTGAVGSVTGAVGSVTGAVGSVTGAVGSVAGNVGGNVVGTVAGVTPATNAQVLTAAGLVPAAVLAAATAAPIAANVEAVNGTTIDGAGTEADPWGPA